MAQLQALDHPATTRVEAAPHRPVALLGWALCGVCIAAAIATVVLLYLNGFGLYRTTLMFAVVASAAMGALIVSRRANAVGWLLLCGGLGFGLGDAALQYAFYGLITRPGALPLAHEVAWLPTILNPLGGFCLLAFLPLVFPTGKAFSPFWQRILWIEVIAAAASIVTSALLPGAVQGTTELSNPLGISALEPVKELIRSIGISVMMVSLVVVVTSLVVRYIRSTGDERLQIKWLTFAVAAWVMLVAPSGWVEAASPQLFLILDTLIMLLFGGIPVAVGIAVLRYRLYEIDLLINRALVYGALTLCVGGLYVVVVAGLGTLLEGQSSTALRLLATLLIAALFAPLRDRLQRRINRLLYGERNEPYTALTRLGERLESTLAPDAILPTIVQTVAETLRLPYAAIVLNVERKAQSNDTGAALNVTYGVLPASLPPAQLVRLPLAYQGQEVGVLQLAPRARNERLSEADWRLLRDLARQAGAAVHAVQLNAALQAGLAEVRRSRERLVTAQEEERRRIQRDLHDGLGPVLASMRLRLEACLDQAQSDAPALVHDLERLDALVGQATTDIRRLVHDLRPPALDQLGLVPALRQHAARFSRETGIAVDLTATVDHALPAAVEVTIFRIMAEALTNVHKYAHATQVTFTLQRLGDALLLHIVDNGVGGAVEGAYEGGGTGLSSMRERAELLGGALVLRSTTGTGTTIEVYLPLREEVL